MDTISFIKTLHTNPLFIPFNKQLAKNYCSNISFHTISSQYNNVHYLFSTKLSEAALSSQFLIPTAPAFDSSVPNIVSDFVSSFPVFCNHSIHSQYRQFIGLNYLKDSFQACEEMAYSFLSNALTNLDTYTPLSRQLYQVTSNINSKILRLSPPLSEIFSLLSPQFATVFKSYPFDFSIVSTDLITALFESARNNESFVSHALSIPQLFFTYFSGSDTLTSLFEIFLYLKSSPSQLLANLITPEDYLDFLLSNFPYFRFIARTASQSTTIGCLSIFKGDTILIPTQLINCLDDSSPKRLTFGFGEYSCIGKHISPVILKVFIELILSDYPELKLASRGFSDHPVLTYLHNPHLV